MYTLLGFCFVLHVKYLINLKLIFINKPLQCLVTVIVVIVFALLIKITLLVLFMGHAQFQPAHNSYPINSHPNQFENKILDFKMF